MLNNDNFKSIIDVFSGMEEVDAIGIGGSSAAETSDSISDIDVYVFINSNISLEKRNEIIKPISSCYEIGCEYFGSGDEFFVDNNFSSNGKKYLSDTPWHLRIAKGVTKICKGP